MLKKSFFKVLMLSAIFCLSSSCFCPAELQITTKYELLNFIENKIQKAQVLNNQIISVSNSYNFVNKKMSYFNLETLIKTSNLFLEKLTQNYDNAANLNEEDYLYDPNLFKIFQQKTEIIISDIKPKFDKIKVFFAMIFYS